MKKKRRKKPGPAAAVRIQDKRCPRGMQVQTLMLSRDRFTPSTAKKWAKDHGFRYSKIHTTENFHRLRQKSPVDFTRDSMRIVKFTRLIKAVVGCPKKKR